MPKGPQPRDVEEGDPRQQGLKHAQASSRDAHGELSKRGNHRKKDLTTAISADSRLPLARGGGLRRFREGGRPQKRMELGARGRRGATRAGGKGGYPRTRI